MDIDVPISHMKLLHATGSAKGQGGIARNWRALLLEREIHPVPMGLEGQTQRAAPGIAQVALTRRIISSFTSLLQQRWMGVEEVYPISIDQGELHVHAAQFLRHTHQKQNRAGFHLQCQKKSR